MALSGIRVQVKITANQTGSDDARQGVLIDYDHTFSDGTGDSQMDKFFYNSARPLNATSEDLDLGTGGLGDFEGTALVLDDLKLVVAHNLDTDSGDTLKFKSASANDAGLLTGTTPALTIYPNGLFLWVAPVDGHTITDGSADRLAFETADNSTYKVLIGGGS